MTDRSAVIVPVPEAEPLVATLRARLDAHALLGVPAHVTVMAPFLDPGALDAATVADLAGLVAGVAPFDVTFTQVRWFGEELVWLAPEPAAPFVALTDAVSSRFGLLPYEGVYGEVVPHLTVAHDAPVDELRAAAAELANGLPVRARVERAVLMVGGEAPGSWRTLTQLPLATRS